MLIGYARVSKVDGQDTATQIHALKSAGVDRIFEEKASGGRWDRPKLHQALEQLPCKSFLHFSRSILSISCGVAQKFGSRV